VLDNGIGVPPQDLPRVFDDFFRGSNVQTKGTGLGLSICRRIVEAHHGRIWAESPCPETGKGSKFSFALPKRQPTASEAPCEAAVGTRSNGTSNRGGSQT
jgi:signal transduction histidine kinase